MTWMAVDDEANKGHRGHCGQLTRFWVRVAIVAAIVAFVPIAIVTLTDDGTADISEADDAKKDDAMLDIVRAAIPPEPNLLQFVQRVENALAPFQTRYRARTRAAESTVASSHCEKGFSLPRTNTLLTGCLNDDCTPIIGLEEAQKFCVNEPDCGGVIRNADGMFEMRRGIIPTHSSDGETAWVRESCMTGKIPVAEEIWHAFSSALDISLNDTSLGLNIDFGPARHDDTIFIAISAHRDTRCEATVRRAFEQADSPEKLRVGVVQQNCFENCMHGRGWGDTRELVPGPAEPDCVAAFCESDKWRGHCEDGRVRILRLNEAQAFGPLFSRFLNAKLWSGENYYLQTDSHTDFRKGWDTTLLAMIKATPTHPKSVISNRPAQGDPKRRKRWRDIGSLEGHDESVTGPLCTCSFKFVDTNDEDTSSIIVDVGENVDVPPREDGVPRHSAFMSPGFFFAHSSFMSIIPPDPFLPYIFIGEDIALTLRFWTAGFDIYSPSADVVKHDYEETSSVKFWESVDMIFDGDLHNQLTAIVIKRVQHLLGMPGRESVEPSDLLTRMWEYGPGKVRTRTSFLEFVGLDLFQHSQVPPSWCVEGEDPPWSKAR